MPAIGGTPRRIASSGQEDQPVGAGGREPSRTAPAWSADGTKVALVRYQAAGPASEPVAEIVSLATQEARRIRLPGSQAARVDLSWSDDERFLAYVDFAAPTAETTQLWVLRLSDGRGWPISDGLTNDRSPRWSPDGRFLYFVSNRAGATDLWRLEIRGDGTPVGSAQQLTTGLDFRHASFSPDGKRLAYSKGRVVSNVWRVPIRYDRPSTWADAQQITFDEAFTEFVYLSRDGRRLLFSSDRAGNQDIWMMPIDGGETVRLTSDPAPDWQPRWSPDESQIAFYSFRTGTREIWTMPSTGGPATQLTHGNQPSRDSRATVPDRQIAFNACPDWSPTGREIAFVSLSNGRGQIWIMPAVGGTARRLTAEEAIYGCPTWSPDGHWLAFFSLRAGKRGGLWRISAQGGEPEYLGEGRGTSPRWSRDGDHIYFVGAEERTGNVWAFSLKTHAEEPVTHLVGRRGNLGVQSLTADNKYLYFTWRDDLGDIWIMDVAK